MKKIKCALIGPGNIGTDLLVKLQRSPVLEPVWMVGIDPSSDGLKRAREMGIKTTADGVDGLLPHVLADGVQIAFDATSAYVHAENARKLNALGVLMIDLTPAAIGPYCVPPVNLKRARRQARDERQHGHLRRPGDDPDGRRGVAACSRWPTARSSPRCPAAVGRARARARTSTSSPAPRPARSRRSAARSRARPSSSSTRPSRR